MRQIRIRIELDPLSTMFDSIGQPTAADCRESENDMGVRRQWIDFKPAQKLVAGLPLTSRNPLQQEQSIPRDGLRILRIEFKRAFKLPLC